jgi:hypothetical protein
VEEQTGDNLIPTHGIHVLPFAGLARNIAGHMFLDIVYRVGK